LKRSRLLLLLFSIFCVGGAASAELKLGFVNLAQIEEQAPQVEAVRAKLQQEFAPRDRELVEDQKALKAMEERLVRDGPAMSPDQRRKLERDIQSRRRDLTRAQEEFREDLTIRRNEELADLNRIFTNAIRDFARSQKYDLILVGGVVYASDRADVTEQVLEHLRKGRAQ
jgi:outer membrane protein